MTALWQPGPDETPAEALGRLGLREQDFTEMMWDGHVASRSVTALEPRNAGGTSRYIRMVGSLRRTLTQRGWSPGDPRGLATITSPDEEITLVVCSGDALAGSIDPRQQPRTRYPKGPMYRAAVSTNRQLMLGDNDPGEDEYALSGGQTWLALWWASPLEGRVEISLPQNVDEAGFVDAWARRIILDPISLGDRILPEDEEPDDDIDIPVEPV